MGHEWSRKPKHVLPDFSPKYYELSSHSRLLREFFLEGKCHAPRVSHPLPLSRTLLPTLLFSSVTLLSLATPLGRRVWLAVFGFYTAVTWLSALLGRK